MTSERTGSSDTGTEHRSQPQLPPDGHGPSTNVESLSPTLHYVSAVGSGGETSPESRAIGRYELQAEIARGGMGVVYRAIDTTLNRDVAVKLVGQHVLQSPAAVQRFMEEGQITAQLQHPGDPASA
jgi:serine/threonine protein kinase